MVDKTIIRTNKRENNNPFVMIERAIFENKTLSWKAKGLLGYLLSRPDNWSVCVADLVERSADGRDSCYGAIKELGDAGYIKKEEKPKKAGRFSGYEYVVYEQPLCNTNNVPQDVPPVGKTVSGESVSGKTVSGESDTNNKDLNNKDCTKRKEENAGANVDDQDPGYAKIETKGPHQPYAAFKMFLGWTPEPVTWETTLKKSRHLVKPEQFTDFTLAEFIRKNADGQEKTESRWQGYYVDALARGMLSKPVAQQPRYGRQDYATTSDDPTAKSQPDHKMGEYDEVVKQRVKPEAFKNKMANINNILGK